MLLPRPSISRTLSRLTRRSLRLFPRAMGGPGVRNGRGELRVLRPNLTRGNSTVAEEGNGTAQIGDSGRVSGVRVRIFGDLFIYSGGGEWLGRGCCTALPARGLRGARRNDDVVV